MIVECPACHARLRINMVSSSDVTTSVRCSRCQTKFEVGQSTELFKVLVAHEDQEVREHLAERLSQVGGTVEFFQSEDGIAEQFQTEQCRVLLIDVAFAGGFPFQLIEQIKAFSCERHKIVLLPSVYNRTAYKKRPGSLYGADAYLELHHIGDRLLPLLSELLPDLEASVAAVTPVSIPGGERRLVDEDILQQAERLARLLVADILLYHQEDLERGLEKGEVEVQFATHLAEGRKLLAGRLPEVEKHSTDFVLQAFQRACQSYSRQQ